MTRYDKAIQLQKIRQDDDKIRHDNTRQDKNKT